jgi:hypothetical protein
MSLPGEPLSQLVMFKQLCNPWFNPITKKTEPRTAYCAVNNPRSFRGRYRNLKSGRFIDTKRIDAAGRDMEARKVMHTTTATQPHADRPHTPQKPNWLQKMAARFNRRFRKQS